MNLYFNKDELLMNFMDDSKTYLTEFLIIIKKINFLKNIQYTTRTIIVDSDSFKHEMIHPSFLPKKFDNDTDDKIRNFISSMQGINNVTHINIKKYCCINSENLVNNTNDSFEKVFSLIYLTEVFVRLQKKFLYDISRLSIDKSTEDDKVLAEVVKNVMIIFKTVCDSAPWILYFIEDNFISNDTSIIFGLYFSYCQNWEHFISTYCPDFMYNKSAIEPNVRCTIDLITNKLKMNSFRITEHNLSYGTDYNVECEQQYINYVDSIVEPVQIYYKDSHVFLWTQCDWMTTNIFFENGYKSPFAYSFHPETDILTYNLKIPVVDVYQLRLQWTLEEVLNYQNYIFNSMYIILIGYVYIHGNILVKLQEKKYFLIHDRKSLINNVITEMKRFVMLIAALCKQYMFPLYGYNDWLRISNTVNKIFLIKNISQWLMNLENSSILHLSKYVLLIKTKYLPKLKKCLIKKQFKKTLLDNCQRFMDYIKYIFNASNGLDFPKVKFKLNTECKDL